MTDTNPIRPIDPMTAESIASEFYRQYRSIDVHDASQLLSPRLDYVFKRIFGSDDPKISGLALRGLLTAVLEIPPDRIRGLTVRNSEIVGEVGGDKTIRLDLLVRLEDGTRVDIEMQMQGLGLEMQARRICYYLCRLYTMEVPAGSEYANLHPAISIVFTDRILFPDEPKALRTFRFRPTDGVPMDLTDALELRIVEMGKCRNQDDPSNDDRLMSWLRFFRYGDTREVSAMLAKKDPAFAQAVDRLTEISQDERERIQAYEREKALLWDAMNRYNKEQQAKQIAEAARAEGVAKGKAEGIAEGEARGDARGEARVRHQMASVLLESGVSIDLIAKAANLPVEEIKRILKED